MTMEGPLSKWTNVMKGWQYRWFVLDDSAGLLSYYTSKDKMVRGTRRGCVRLRNAVVGIDDDDDSTFTITVDAKTFHFQAHDREEREMWIRALEDTILHHALAMTRRWDPSRPPPTMADFDKKLTESDGYLQLLIEQAQQLQRVLPQSDIDRERTTDVLAKLSSVIETVKHSIVLLQIAKNTAFPANGVYQPCNAVPDSAATTAINSAGTDNSVGGGNVGSSGNSSDEGGTCGGNRTHSLLQATSRAGSGSSSPAPRKGGVSEVAGIAVPLSSPTQRRLQPTANAISNNRQDVDDCDVDSDDPVSFMSEQVHTGIEVAREVVCGSLGSTGGGSVPATNRRPSGASSASAAARLRCSTSVPETSYSSSEDEDFFDADEYAAASSPLGPRLSTSFPGEGGGVGDPGEDGSRQALLRNANTNANYSATDGIGKGGGYEPPNARVAVVSSPPTADTDAILSQPIPAPSNSGVDYDALYDDEDEEDAVSMEGHGFIIQHLISQVKIGMDLTKVVLPTFILERRSLLEMYADFFAHPDLFCGISSGSDPKARMVAVVKWYLSAFHAGRRSEVAKKPYNPIIGEVFRCHWDIPGMAPAPRQTGGTAVTDSGKPMPWVRDDQLAFVAEQVSHHPPISAFYAESVSRRISFCGHIWTKSKFLGLSVCVYNIGQGCVSVLQHDEEYIVNFPSGYGRSILTVPWVELGGSCQITCSKTGYSATIEFLTKPFYGGKKHRVSVDVFSPGEKKPFMTVDGEWNGSMTAKWADDGHTESFVDTQCLAIVRKQVRPIAEQQSNESRKLWKDCTAGLKFNNIEAATEAKFALEQKQREEAKQRKETGESWQTRLFSLQGEDWIYHTPLVTRMSSNS